MKKVSDLIASTLSDGGIEQVFMVTGGGAMHLNDAFGRNKRFKIQCNHHEQASAMAAESYARLSGKPAVVNVTTGPGGINALNGVFGAYTDSIPMVVISGQVKRQTIAGSVSPPLRQLGDQEVDIIQMVKPISKYASVLWDPQNVKLEIQKALDLATSGRPGPVWIDIPVDVQGALVDETALPIWSRDQWAIRSDSRIHPNTLSEMDGDQPEVLAAQAREIVKRLTEAKRPVLFAGAGIRLSGTTSEFFQVVEKLGIPVVTGWNAHDLVPNAHPSYAGRPGTVGDRPGNFTVQNADFLLVLGSRLNIRQVSYNWEAFAHKAWKAHVDIDRAELDKPTLRTDLKVHGKLQTFLPILMNELNGWKTPQKHQEFLRWCRQRVEQYPVVHKEYWNTDFVNPYCFIDHLFQVLEDQAIVVTGNGTACVTSFQAGVIKSGTRLYTNSGSASMGYDLPAALGAAVAAPGSQIICLAGDGSIMMNVQELATIKGYDLPVKVFILNNRGYHSIRQTQKAYFSDNLIGIDQASGVFFPEFQALASGFGLPFVRVSTHAEFSKIDEFLHVPGPAVCEVVLDLDQDFSPKLTSRKLPDGTMVSPALEDMAPFLSRDELKSNILED